MVLLSESDDESENENQFQTSTNAANDRKNQVAHRWFSLFCEYRLDKSRKISRNVSLDLFPSIYTQN